MLFYSCSIYSYTLFRPCTVQRCVLFRGGSKWADVVLFQRTVNTFFIHNQKNYKFRVLKFIFFNIFHIHALNDDSIYKMRPTNTHMWLYLSHLIHYRRVFDGCRGHHKGNQQDNNEITYIRRTHRVHINYINNTPIVLKNLNLIGF